EELLEAGDRELLGDGPDGCGVVRGGVLIPHGGEPVRCERGRRVAADHPVEEARPRRAECTVGGADELLDRREGAVSVLRKRSVQPGSGGIGARPTHAIGVNVSQITLRGLGRPIESLSDELTLAEGVAHAGMLARVTWGGCRKTPWPIVVPECGCCCTAPTAVSPAARVT